MPGARFEVLRNQAELLGVPAILFERRGGFCAELLGDGGEKLRACVGLGGCGGFDEEAIVSADHGGLGLELELQLGARRRGRRVAEAALELGRVDDFGELIELGDDIVEGGEVQRDAAAAQLDRPAIDGLQVAGLELRGKGETQLAARGLGRVAAEIFEMRAKIVGIHTALEEAEQGLALDDDGVGLAHAGHEPQ
jgi:hypothetical protein